MNTLIGLKTCSTCREVEKLLIEANIPYRYKDVRKNRPTIEELKTMVEWIGFDKIDGIVNTRGNIFRQENLREVWPQLSLEAKLEKLAQDGMLIKRPILLRENQQVLIGAKEIKRWVKSNDN